MPDQRLERTRALYATPYIGWRYDSWRELTLLVRTYHCLDRAEHGEIRPFASPLPAFRTIGDLADWPDRQLLKIRDFGKVTLRDLRDSIATYIRLSNGWNVIEGEEHDADDHLGAVDSE